MKHSCSNNEGQRQCADNVCCCHVPNLRLLPGCTSENCMPLSQLQVACSKQVSQVHSLQAAQEAVSSPPSPLLLPCRL